MSDSTLKEDIAAALRKERNRLNAIPSADLTDDDETRLSLCVEYLKLINQSVPGREATLEIRNFWAQPIKL